MGVDASDDARRALHWALEEGAVRHESVEAVAVWSYVDQTELTRQGFFPEFDELSACRDLHDFVASCRAEAGPGLDGVEVIERAVCDLPATALLDASASADLLVVGARGLGGFRGLLLGSVSDQCVRHSRCPTVVVRPPVDTASVEMVTETVQATGIVVGVDGSDGSLAALAWAVDEAERRDTTVCAVRSWQFPAISTAAFEPIALAEYGAGVEQALDESVRGFEAARGGLAVSVDTHVTQGHPGTALMAAASDAELLVVGTRGSGGFADLLLGSTTMYCVHHRVGPLVVVPVGSRSTGYDVGRAPQRSR